jgi:hypothetical protein
VAFGPGPFSGLGIAEVEVLVAGIGGPAWTKKWNVEVVQSTESKKKVHI